MSRDRPLLSIAIPTYNRSANLALLLKNLAPQLVGESRVELLISDNCSPDDTEAMVGRFMDQGLHCRYLRNEKNIGPDLNFLQCYDFASGEYVWIFGDDDVILPGCIDFLLGRIDGGNFDLVFMRPVGFVDDPSERAVTRLRPDCKEYSDVASFIHAVGLCGDFALISGLLVNKRLAESQPHREYSAALDTILLQLSWVFTTLNHFQKGLVIQRGLFSVCEKNPSRPFDVAQVFGANWHRLVKLYIDEGSSAERALLNDQLYSWFPTNWFGQRRTLVRTQVAPPHQLLRPLYGDRWLYWIFVYPLLVWPWLFAGGWLVVLRFVRKVDRAFHRLG